MREQIIVADLFKNRKEFEEIAREVINDEDRRCESGC